VRRWVTSITPKTSLLAIRLATTHIPHP